MSETKAVAIVGIGAIMPDAFDAPTFWQNIKQARYSITEVPPERWRVDLYYDPDPSVPDKTYSKIGAWVRGFKFEPFKLGIAIPPKVLAAMDEAQQWAIAASHQALDDYGYPKRPLNPERVAVIFGNALGGEYHYRTTMRIYLPEYLDMLASLPDFQNLPREVQAALMNGLQERIRSRISDITEDTMPGELSNIIAGRVANVFNFSGPNYVTDAACAASIAALQNAVEGLMAHQFDAVLTGGIDRGMGPEAFVKFSKIGALSPDGSRPFAEGANGFVMGEGAAVFLLKRLVDAEKDGDKIYAVIRGVGGSSDGKGKGITAPNPLGQQRAIERAWRNAGLSPATAGMIEAHGTSTRVGDVTEVNSLNAVFAPLGLPVGKVALGSVKSNIGHLKSAAGAAGLLKAVYALYERVIPPSVNFERPNPNIDFARLPFYVPTQARPWEVRQGEVRRAGVSSFGFGGTNFHVVLEEYLPGMLTGEKVYAVPEMPAKAETVAEPAIRTVSAGVQPALKPYNGLLFLSANDTAGLMQALRVALERAARGEVPLSVCPSEEQLRKPERLAIDFADADELLKRGERALKALENPTPGIWTALTAQGIFYGSGEPGKVVFMFPGQGSQYVNMLRELRDVEPVVAETFEEADRIMVPILGRPLTSYIFVDGDEAALAQAEKELRNTAITQPAMLTANVAVLRVMEKYGFHPHLVIGHSLGEYAALVAAEVMSFAEALEVVSARGREMTKVSLDDNGAMVAVSAPLEEVEQVLKTVEGYAVIANINSPMQSVIGGSTVAMESALAIFQKAGFQASKIPVSHAFHTKIVAPASEPLRRVIESKNIRPPKIPVVANVTGELYPTNREEIIEMLAQQLASPVQMVKSMQTLYREGARVFVEIGPKRVISALATDNLKHYQDVIILGTNHPRKGALVSLNEALCGLYAAGVVPVAEPLAVAMPSLQTETPAVQGAPVVIHHKNGRLPLTGSVVISGAGLGLPGRGKAVFDERNVLRLLNGEMLIEPLTEEKRRAMLAKRVTRLVKSESGAVMETIDDLEQTVKLGGQGGVFNLEEEFGIPRERVEATDISTQLAIAAGIDALRDAGIPLVMAYRQTSKGT
ncbi:MAG: type I polyketide synthase, partial [Anaerolineales bacterium]